MNALKIAEAFPPAEYLRDELKARGWTQTDLARVLGRPLQFVNALCNGRKLITAETAWGLGQAFGTGPEVWLNLQSTYQLWIARPKSNAVERRAKALAG
jgi:HTH-type transcriptional regulator/antitoxin HigA